MASGVLAQTASPYSWRYYRPGNTGIQGDYCDALWISADGDPWIGGYDASFEEGGIAKFIQSENRWLNISSVDTPAFGHPDQTGMSRIGDFAEDANGVLWMGTGHGALKFNPADGISSIQRFYAGNSQMMSGWCRNVEIAPDGTIWFSSYSTAWGDGGLARYNPSTNTWTKFASYGDGDLGIQPRPGGGYYVWTRNYVTGKAARWTSTTGTWTEYNVAVGNPGNIVGKTATDASGNTWMTRIIDEFGRSELDLRRPDGSWVGISAPFAEFWGLRAFGNGQALAVDGGSTVWRYDGSGWINLGAWRTGAFSNDVGMDSDGNVWVCGTGGAAVRDAQTGTWQRHRLTNNGNMDSFINDLTVGADGTVYASSNGAPGIGGMAKFDGTRWTNFNQEHHGLGIDWPFPTDNSEAVLLRKNGNVVVNPMFNGVHEYSNGNWQSLNNSADVVGMVEDSLDRLWVLGEYFNLKVQNGNSWTDVGITAWGSRIQVDPSRAGTIWAATGHEVKRTDGATTLVTKSIDDFPELTSQSDTFSGLAVGPDGTAWVGCTVMLGAGGDGGGLIRINPNGTTSLIRWETGWNLPGRYVTPLCVTPDGRVWMVYVNTHQYFDGGLCWYDGTNVGTFPGPVDGAPQWGGLPHTQVKDAEVRVLPDGYEIWMSCLSRGMAVLSVRRQLKGQVTLEDFGGVVNGRTITVEIVGGLTHTATLDGQGRYSVPAPANGTYSVRIKGSHWLTKAVGGVVVTDNGAANVNASLINGDVDGDNEVGPGDFGSLATAFLSVSGDQNWNEEADLDGDGEVGPGDFGILATNFLTSGD